MTIVDIPVSILIAVAAISVVGGVFRGFAGFGSGLIMAPVITWLVAPEVGVPAMLIMSFLASGRLVPDAWDRIEWRRVAWVAIPAVASVPLGTWLLTGLEPRYIQKGVSAVVLVMVAILARGWRIEGPVGPRLLVPAGLVSGVLTAVGGVGGPPVVLLLMAEDHEPALVRANLIGFFVISQIASLVTFGSVGLITEKVLVLALISAPIFVLSIHIGTRVFKGRLQGNYRPLALGLLAIVAIGGLVV